MSCFGDDDDVADQVLNELTPIIQEEYMSIETLHIKIDRLLERKMQKQRIIKAKGFEGCPFCGSPIESLIKTDELVMLECPECHASLCVYSDESDDCVEELRKKWNKCQRKKKN